MNIFVVSLQGRVIGTCGQVINVFSALLELVQYRPEDVPVSLSFGEDAYRKTAAVCIFRPSAEEEEFEPDQQCVSCEYQYACNTDDYREEHASRTGVYI